MQDVRLLKAKLVELESELKRVSVVNEGGKIQVNGSFSAS